MITLEGIEFAYDERPVIDDLSLEAAADERLALVGSNGAGKTTLLRLLADLVAPGAGTRRVDGMVGFAPEDPQSGLFAASVRDEIAFFPRNRGLDVEEAVASAMELMSLTHLSERSPYTLSTGEQRRVSIASVLSGAPDVLLLDEPTTGLDRRGARELADHLAALDTTIVFSTHDTDFAYELADRVAVLDGGSLQRVGPGQPILADEALLREAGVRPPGIVQWAHQAGLEDLPDDLDEAIAMAGAGQ